MSVPTTISKRIIEEIESDAADKFIAELALSLLRFEMANWRLGRVNYTPTYLKEIERYSRQRMARNED